MSFFHMHALMFVLFHQLQVLDSVVRSVMVDMMNDLVVLQISTDQTLNQDCMKHHITIAVCVRMFWSISKNITTVMAFCVSIPI